jgi:hypothetical protein
VVALSSCEAEYQGIWLTRLLIDMLRVESGMPELFMDNQSAIALCKNLVFHDRSKHIDVRFYFIRDCIEEERIKLDYVTTEKQLADLLTKAPGWVHFQELRGKVGVKVTGDRAQD